MWIWIWSSSISPQCMLCVLHFGLCYVQHCFFFLLMMLFAPVRTAMQCCVLHDFKVCLVSLSSLCQSQLVECTQTASFTLPLLTSVMDPCFVSWAQSTSTWTEHHPVPLCRCFVFLVFERGPSLFVGSSTVKRQDPHRLSSVSALWMCCLGFGLWDLW